MYGPTTGDIVRLADSELYICVENDFTVYGDECKFGGGKVLREGMGQATGWAAALQLDTVITNALVVDAITGIYKADIGIKGGYITGIGKAGNPDVMAGVTDVWCMVYFHASTYPHSNSFWPILISSLGVCNTHL